MDDCHGGEARPTEGVAMTKPTWTPVEHLTWMGKAVADLTNDELAELFWCRMRIAAPIDGSDDIIREEVRRRGINRLIAVPRW